VQVIRAGADTVVVGRAIFKDGRIAANVRALREAASGSPS